MQAIKWHCIQAKALKKEYAVGVIVFDDIIENY